MIRQRSSFDPEYKWFRARYQPCIPLGEGGKKVSACEEHCALAKEAAIEGMVLLKNVRRTLPLKQNEKIALFGKGAADTVIGGRGSGDVTTAPYTVSIFEGLCRKEKEGKLSLFKDDSATAGQISGTANKKRTERLLKKAGNFCSTAVFVISRVSGEGMDRSDDFDMLPEEAELFRQLENTFENIIVLLNICGPVNTKPFVESEKVGAILACFASGIEGGNACADLLCGDRCPSGKLTDTYADSLDAYPSAATFSESDDYVTYSEDIYVGYRYFESFPAAQKQVVFPFGYGLSYTEFKVRYSDTVSEKGKITVTCTVQNIGKICGKETVQLYFSAPQGKLGKAARELVAFQKTKLLKPDERQKLTLTFYVSDMASYDDVGKLKKSAYLLEKGDYRFYLGTDVRNAAPIDFIYTVRESFVVTEQLTERCKPAAPISRLTADGKYEDVPFKERCLYPAPKCSPTALKVQKYDKVYKLIDVATKTVSIDRFLAQLTDDELIRLTGDATPHPNTGVANTCGIGNLEKYGIPNIMTADGPAGVRIHAQAKAPATYWPMSTLLASTWNPEIVKKVGMAAALEVKENNMDIWLAPGMNIHRSPLCGRNFEYYSEDPFLTGVMATAMVKGVQSKGVAACVKHFCCNNKETNRLDSDSRVSERALREIYLKGFRLAVRDGKPWMLMTSYNKMNGIFTSTNRELLTDILRGEWGFDGCITSDWCNRAPHLLELKAGNNVKMPHGFPEAVKEGIRSLDINRDQILENAKRVVELILRIGD